MHELCLQLLLLNFGDGGKRIGGHLVQGKTLMLFDGTSSNSYYNQESIRLAVTFYKMLIFRVTMASAVCIISSM